MYASKPLNRFKSLILTFVVSLIVLVFIPFSFWNTNFISIYINSLVPITSLLTTFLLIYTTWWSYKTQKNVFKPWLLLTMGMILYSINYLLIFIFKDIIGVVSSSSIAYVAYLAAYILLIIGTISFLDKPFIIRSKALLDMVIVMVSAFFIVWFLFIWPTVGPSQPDTLSEIFSISYLFLDLILLFVLLTLLFNENKKISELPIALISFGIFFQVFGDMIYSYYVINPSLIYEWLFNILYTSTLVFMALAIISFLKDVNVNLDYLLPLYKKLRAQNVWISYLPLILVLFTYSILIITIPDEALVWGVGIIIIMVIVRQIISLNEIKKAQRILNRNKELISKREEQLSFITSNMMDLITESDRNGIYKYVTPSSKQLLGYSPESLVGKSFYDFVHPDDAEEVTNNLKESVDSTRLQYRYKNADGKYIWLESIGKPIFEDNEIKRFIYSSRDISEQKRADEFIKNSLIEKNTLLKEIHHRVNNNLQIIISLLSLQSKNVVSDEDYELFVESQNRVRSMAMIHEKLYQSKNLSSINFSDYLKVLLDRLMQDYHGNISQIDLDLDVGEIELNIETSIPCGLIINELVSNTLKHAFPPGRRGKITVKMHLENNEYTLIVGDNGLGQVKELDLKNKTTLGLQLVSSLVDQLDGNIEILKEKGTVYKITFHELKYSKRV